MNTTHTHRTGRTAFTLIELLVVVAIIAMLVALILPAFGKAKTRAKMLQCLANERMIGISALSYAMDNNQYYPYRQCGSVNGVMPNVLFDSMGPSGVASDDRPMFNAIMNVDQALTCPFSRLAPGVSLSRPTQQAWSSYELWFGTPIDRNQPQSAMMKVGNRPIYDNPWGTYQFNVLASDFERDWDGSGVGGWSSAILSAHQDENNSLARFEIYDGSYTVSLNGMLFGSPAEMTRAMMERNFLFDDGSAKGRRLSFRDPSMARVQAYPWSAGALSSAWLYLPPM